MLYTLGGTSSREPRYPLDLLIYQAIHLESGAKIRIIKRLAKFFWLF